jgi:predicted permease
VELFFVLLSKLLALYAMIALGWIAGRYLEIDAKPFARFLIYLLVPIVFFDSILKARLEVQDLILPFLFLGMCSVLCFVFFRIAGRFYREPTKNILAFAAGSANTGYFGIPATIFILGEAYLGKAILAIFGYNLYESTVGYYVTARGHFTPRDALMKVLRLPSLYAFILAIILNFSHWSLPQFLSPVTESARSAYSLLGLMIVGIGVSKIKRSDFDWTFISLCFVAKFLIFPVLIFAFIALDKAWLGLFNEDIYKILKLMAVVPLAANGVAVATELRANPEKVSLAILCSTIFALFFIPLFVIFFF